MPLPKTRAAFALPLLCAPMLIACSNLDHVSSVAEVAETNLSSSPNLGTAQNSLSFNNAWKTYGTGESAGDTYGFSAALSNKYMIVGSRGNGEVASNSGKSHIYHRKLDGSWEEDAALWPDPDSIGARFGNSVAISDDVAVVGAFLDQDQQIFTGAAYVFRRNAGTWEREAKLIANDLEGYALFGHSVGISKNTIIVGAFQANNDKGAAYIFDWNGKAWIETAKLVASDGDIYDGFGVSVAIDGSIAVIGAESSGDLGEGSGSAYIFSREGGEWVEKQKLYSNDGCAYQFFGNPVAISGDTILAGAYLSSEDNELKGAVYSYRRTPSEWIFDEKLTASDGQPGDGFGISVSIDGQLAAIGAYCVDAMGNDAGAGYIFERTANGWQQKAKVLPSAAMGNNKGEMGYSSAISQHEAVFGAPSTDDLGSDSGAIYISAFDSFLVDGEPCTSNNQCSSLQCCIAPVPNVIALRHGNPSGNRGLEVASEREINKVHNALSGICCGTENLSAGNNDTPTAPEDIPKTHSVDSGTAGTGSESATINNGDEYVAMGGWQCAWPGPRSRQHAGICMFYLLCMAFLQRRRYCKGGHGQPE